MNPRQWVTLYSGQRLFLVLVLGAAVFGLVSGCGSREVVQESPVVHFNFEKIAFLPVKNMSRVYGVNASVLSPFSGKYFLTGRVSDSSERFMTDRLWNLMSNRKGFELLPESQTMGALAKILADDRMVSDEKKMISEIGKNLGADAVVTGCIYKFEERVGSPHSVTSPAAVAFEVCLIETMSGSILWTRSFTETQQSLSENLFHLSAFLKRKGQWVTAEEMAASALEEMMRTFPEL